MKDKKFLLWTTLVILLPILPGIFLWDRLPEQLPTHWGFHGEADGWGGRAFAVFAIPGTMLLGHWICILGTRLDKRNLRGNEKLMRLILMIFPVMSLIFAAVLYGPTLGMEFRITNLMLPLLGLMIVGIGNYLPKCRQNATLGIKLPWTLYNEENWNRTHRFGGKVWVVCGVAMMALAFLPQKYFGWVMAAVLSAAALAPAVYSWRLYKTQLAEGRWTQSEGSIAYSVGTRRLGRVGTVAAIAIAAVAIGSLFTGSIEYSFRDDHLFVDASHWEDSVIYYDVIDDVELWEEGVSGSREYGYGSLRLLLGAFYNEEFGNYTRYTYAGDAPCVVIYSGEKIMVLGAQTPAATRELYEQLLNAAD